jgi:glutamate-1-semialdehyde 2,1-aminomutase
VATLAIPGTPGVSSRVVEQTLVVPYNDVDAVQRLARERGKEIACLIVEPVAANMGVVPPARGYLEGLREITKRHGIVLIFDEVISGFRVALGGAQQHYGVTPDLTTLGKILGGGLPIGAYGGRADIMSHVAPEGDVYQAGTLSGNPLAVRAGIAMLKALRAAGVYERLEAAGARLGDGLRRAFEESGTPTRLNRIGSLMTMFFCAREPVDWTTASASDAQRYGAFFRGMLKRGVYLAPSQFEAMFVSLAHSDELIDRTVAAARDTLRETRGGAS